MSYNFAEVAADAHNDTWEYNTEERCGYTSLRQFEYGCYSVAWMDEDDGDINDEDWKVDCAGFNEEYVIDWSGEDVEEMMKVISTNAGDMIVKFRVDSMRAGVICVDYNSRDVYIGEASDYNAVDFYTYQNGQLIDEE